MLEFLNGCSIIGSEVKGKLEGHIKDSLINFSVEADTVCHTLVSGELKQLVTISVICTTAAYTATCKNS
jgi:hypothetical protein